MRLKTFMRYLNSEVGALLQIVIQSSQIDKDGIMCRGECLSGFGKTPDGLRSCPQKYWRVCNKLQPSGTPASKRV